MEDAYGSPDSLQDLCLFYCMNKLDILHTSLKSWQLQNSDMSPFPMMLGNNMLNYLLNWGVYNKDEHVNELLKSEQLCNILNIRRWILSEDNLLSLAQNSLRELCLAIPSVDLSQAFDYDSPLAFLPESISKSLIESSRNSLVVLKLFLTYPQRPQTEENVELSSEQRECKAGPLNALSRFFHRRKREKHQCRHSMEAAKSGDAKAEDVGMFEPMIEPENHFQHLKAFSVIVQFLTETDSKHIVSSLKQFIAANKQLNSLCIVSSMFYPVFMFTSEELTPLRNLQSLVLSFSDSRDPLSYCHGEGFQYLANLRQLRHLDVSCRFVEEAVYRFSEDQVHTFTAALQQMRELQSLEVAGTNLDQAIVNCHFNSTENRSASEEDCTVQGPPPLGDRKLLYLGVFGCHAGSKHADLPATKVSGTCTEEQLLVALWMYTHNKCITMRVLSKVKFHVKHLQVKKPQAFIEGLINLSEELLEMRGSMDSIWLEDLKLLEEFLTCLHLLVRLDPYHVTVKNRRILLQFLCVTITNCVRDITASHYYVSRVARLATLLLVQLNVFDICVYSHQFEKFVLAMKDIVAHRNSKISLKMVALRVLHELCRVSQQHKAIVGRDLNLIKFLLDSIEEMTHSEDDVDELIEKQWSILWSLTDEVPSNCEDFLALSGMAVVESSLEQYSDYTPMCRKITGAMSNVSENVHLRPQLMTPVLVQLFRRYLEYSGEEDYDVSSHAASFLVLLASDGPEAWTLDTPTRDEVLQEVDDLIRKWDINKSKGVKFRSLQPMLIQIQNRETPVAQLWGAWVICNLVIVKPNTYCKMLETEEGLEVITAVLEENLLRQDIKELLLKILNETAQYRLQPNLRQN